MFVLEDYGTAVAFCVITMLCWGSWANTQKLAGKTWRFELFYWDYVFGVLLMALVFAFSMGSFGQGGRGFLEDLMQADASNLGLALAGGAVFNAANIMLVAAIAVAGMAVAFPIGIGIALVEGVLINYFLTSVKPNPVLLFTGVGFVTAAIILCALAYSRLPREGKGGTFRGLILAVFCGILMGMFYYLVKEAMPEPDPKKYISLPAGKLSPYTAMILFSLGMLASQLVFNLANIISWATRPEPPKPDYLKARPREHLWGILGGMIWAVGMTLNIIAMAVAKPAISYGLGQGATMVAAFWGVFIWREFRRAPPGTNLLIWLMFAGYIVGLSLIVWAGA
ncbi:MAG: GRP family sugar transporter [Planctomycetota bacterium]|jgi:glucose uptake protein